MKNFNVNIAQAVIFFLIIAGTQSLISAHKPVSFEQHVQVQQELSELIANYVATNLPEMKNFKMYSVYTKAPKKGLMEAYFIYSFDTPVVGTLQVATTELAGVATLRKIQEVPNLEWALEKIEIEGETLTFSEPLVITAGGEFEEVKPADETPVGEFKEVEPAKEQAPTQAPAPAPVQAPVSTQVPAPTPATEVTPTVQPESPAEVNQ